LVKFLFEKRGKREVLFLKVCWTKTPIFRKPPKRPRIIYSPNNYSALALKEEYFQMFKNPK